jgi:hypothetical protein
MPQAQQGFGGMGGRGLPPGGQALGGGGSREGQIPTSVFAVPLKNIPYLVFSAN